MMKKNFYSQLTPYKLLQLLIQIIGFSLFLLVFFGLAHRADNTEKIVSAEGLQELNKTKDTIAQMATDLDAITWGLGGNKTASKNQWIYDGAYFVLPDCIEYKNFEELLFKQGFKYQFPSGGAFYCNNNVSISSIESETNQAVGEGATRKYWVCGRISFTYSWQKDKNDTNYSCPRIID
jgi:hypothetical protein